MDNSPGLTARVAAAIEKYFAEAERPVIVELLSRYEGRSPAETERIHLLILRMSRREVERVRRLVDYARRDYRDIIAWESQPVRTYIIGLLRRGPNAPAGDRTALKLDSLRQWKAAGNIVIGGLCTDKSAVLGLYIFTVDSIEAAQTLVSADPGIQSGHLEFEFHPWMTSAGLQVGIPKDFLDV